MSEKQKPLEQIEQDYLRAQAETGLNEEELAETLAVRGSVSRQVRSLLGDEMDTKVLKQKETQGAFDERLHSEISGTLDAIGKGQPRYMSLEASDDFQNQLHLLAYEKLNQYFPNNVDAKKKFLNISRKIQTQPKENQMIMFGTLQSAIEMAKGNMEMLSLLFDSFLQKGPTHVRNITEFKTIIKDSPENVKAVSEKLEELQKESGDRAVFNLTFNRNSVVHDMPSFMRRADYLQHTFGRIENNFAYNYFEETYKKHGKEKAISFIQRVVSKYKPTFKEADVIELAKAA